ncbi:hypothetical protein SAMN05216474_1250 [Lishizhenia tianjinensis]|uniref:Uncharacterized protein n=1 Tax=Lishizhenia tianjinensis TaxID=477690 RepID=A0A1I6YWU2_9FLAO|nr:hypothetical protein [Lishizhenia tianjinensis]SFT54932.1 hypothetical protein SAMN05216474_1250 [Lishizhenia tianjinensis]
MTKLLTYLFLGLVLLYTFGAGNSFLPLCESNDIQIEHAKFEHREHPSHIEHGHEHTSLIEHGEHYDEGVFDLLLCYLTENEHLGDSIKVEIFSADQISQVFILSLVFTFALIVGLQLIDLKAGKQYDFYRANIYQPPQRKQHLLRGPPSQV